MSNMIKASSKCFNSGVVYCTAGIGAAINADSSFATEILLCLERYFEKDWGELSNEDKRANELALLVPEDLHLLAAYKTCRGKVWIITERISEKAGDNATTICFPNER